MLSKQVKKDIIKKELKYLIEKVGQEFMIRIALSLNS
jgi:hypothetical protein